MRRWRLVVLLVLFTAPVAVLLGLGAYYLWAAELLWLWWPLLATFGLGYFLAWRWTRRGMLPRTEPPSPFYWTERDQQAWARVAAAAERYSQVTLETLGQVEHYSQLAVQLAREVATVYHPDAEQPFDHLTLPEVLSCVELAAADLNELVQKYVPGSHLLRIGDLRRAKQLYEWYREGQNLYWLISALFDPVRTAIRYGVARGVFGPLLERARDNVIVWFHTAFIHRYGYYLIELHSGRLRVGVARYRQLMATHQVGAGLPQDHPSTEPPAATVRPAATPGQAASAGRAAAGTSAAESSAVESSAMGSSAAGTSAAVGPPPTPPPLRIAVTGPRGAGKSALIAALLGHAATAAPSAEGCPPVPPEATPAPLPPSTPASTGDASHHVALADGVVVELQEVPGYGETTDEQDLAAALAAAQQADVVVLTTSAVVPGRHKEIAWWDRLQELFAARPELRLPPLIVAVTHVDLLPPRGEWQPPYRWREGSSAKEAAIRDCLAYVAEQFGPRAAAVVPVALRLDAPWGVAEELLPAIARQLTAARGTALLRAFAEANENRWGKLAAQLGQLARAAWQRWQNSR